MTTLHRTEARIDAEHLLTDMILAEDDVDLSQDGAVDSAETARILARAILAAFPTARVQTSPLSPLVRRIVLATAWESGGRA